MFSIEDVSKVSKLLVLAVLCTTLKSIQGDCDICHAEYSVACHSETVYSLCTDGVAKRDYITCPEDHVCTGDFLFCQHKNNAAPSCSRTTTQIPRDAETHCKEVKETGSYKPDGDTQCTTFVYCFLMNNGIYGIIKKCSTGQYFNPIEKICESTKPDGCD